MVRLNKRGIILLVGFAILVAIPILAVEAMYIFKGGNPIYSWQYLQLVYNNNILPPKAVPSLHPNDSFIINRKVCTSKAISVTIDKNIIGLTPKTITVEKDPSIMPFKKGCNPMSVLFTVPKQSTPGTYEYEVKIIPPSLPGIINSITLPKVIYNVMGP